MKPEFIACLIVTVLVPAILIGLLFLLRWGEGPASGGSGTTGGGCNVCQL